MTGAEPAEVSATERVVLLGKPGCHLCDEARVVVERVCADVGVRWSERDVRASEEDLQAFGELIPVVFVDGVQHDYWRVNEARLRAALAT